MPLELIYAFAHLKSVAAEVNGSIGKVIEFEPNGPPQFISFDFVRQAKARVG